MILGFWASIIFSQLSNGYIYGAIKGLSDFSMIVFLYFIVSKLVSTKKQLYVLMATIVLLSLFLSISGIIQFNTGFSIGKQTMIEGRIRLLGIFSDPNDLALAFAQIFPLLIMVIISKIRFKYRLICVIACIPILYALWLTNSRGGMLSLGAATLYFLYRKFQSNRGFIVKVAIVIALILVVGLKFGPSRMSTISTQEESAHGRIEGMRNGFTVMRSNPKNIIFGGGYGAIAERYYFVAHNSFMHAAGETGLVGLFFLIGTFYISIRNLLKIPTLSNSPHMIDISYALLASHAALIVGTLFLTRIYSQLPYLLVAMSVAAYNLCGTDYRENPNIFTRNDTKNIILIVFGGLIFFFIVVKLFI